MIGLSVGIVVAYFLGMGTSAVIFISYTLAVKRRRNSGLFTILYTPVLHNNYYDYVYDTGLYNYCHTSIL